MSLHIYMGMPSSERVVQTELSEEEYEKFVRIAEKEDKSLKQLLREAANEYTSRHEEIDMSDPFFEASFVEASEEKKTAEETDEHLY
jgi:hypothetical protein